MPIYEFLCANGHKFEQWAKIGKAPEQRSCLNCQARAKRIMSLTGWNTGAVSQPSDFRDSRRESDYDRNLAKAFSLGNAIQKANKRMQ